jgi:hypothetical protein
MKKLVVTGIFLALPMSGFASDGDIGIFLDGEPVCGATVPCGESVTLEVYALLDGASSGGISGAEYSLAFGPVDLSSDGTSEDLAGDGLAVIEQPSPTAIVIGSAAWPPDPSPRGINLAWPSCQTGDGTKVLLETLVVVNFGCEAGDTPVEVPIHIIRHDSPSNAFFQCPLFTLCDAPAFTKVCLGDDLITCVVPLPPYPLAATCSTSGEFILNPGPFTCSQEVLVDLKPGSDPNCVKTSSGGVVSVAVLTTEDFDAATIDPYTGNFGGAQYRRFSIEDVDDDGDHDVVFKFKTQDVMDWPMEGSDCGDVIFTAETYDGLAVAGVDLACLTGEVTCETADDF